jgi:hypothetical protein
VRFKEVREEEMAKYLFIYHGGNPEKPETDPKKIEKTMAVWMKWFGDLGKAVVDPGAPTKAEKLVSRSGLKDIPNPLAGYSIIQADNLDAAIKFARSHPDVSAGMEIAIYEVLPI